MMEVHDNNANSDRKFQSSHESSRSKETSKIYKSNFGIGQKNWDCNYMNLDIKLLHPTWEHCPQAPQLLKVCFCCYQRRYCGTYMEEMIKIKKTAAGR